MLARIFPLTAILIVSASTAFGQSSDATVLSTFTREFTQAFIMCDIGKLDSMMVRSFVSTGSDGTVMDRTQYLKFAKDSAVKINLEELDPIIVGDTGVVTGRESIEGTAGGQKFSGDFFFTATLVRQKGKWKAMALHEGQFIKRN